MAPDPTTSAQDRVLVENLTPGHLTPVEFYNLCVANASVTQTPYDVALAYARGVINGT